MNEISIHINVYPIKKLEQSVYKFEADSFDFDPTPEDNNAGRFYNCDKDIYISKPSAEILKEFSNPQYAIVEFTSTRQEKYRIGTSQIPALISLSPHLNTATLHVKCKMIHSPLI